MEGERRRRADREGAQCYLYFPPIAQVPPHNHQSGGCDYSVGVSLNSLQIFVYVTLGKLVQKTTTEIITSAKEVTVSVRFV